ncbi:hypothetical protein KA111_00350 [Candidatus Woesebacteria bacterium]|nr:hypothetical protein [Candidatus Woesebacteria bacterium]
MHKKDLQEIIAHFTFVGTIDRKIFTKQNITEDINAYCISTEHGYFVLFQADYISSDKDGIEKVVFHICKRNLNVIPRLMIPLIKGGEYQLITEIEGSKKKYLNKFVTVSVALNGDARFYKRWFKSRTK